MLESIPALAAGAIYWRGTSRLWRRAGVGKGVSVSQALCFFAGLLFAFAAVASPLDTLAHTLFAGHMAQHMLLMVVAAPLLAYGSPGLPGLWALPERRRSELGKWWARSGARKAMLRLTHPVIVWCAFTLVLWTWHLPYLYQLAVVNRYVHALEHGTLLLASYLFWWSLLQPLGRRRLHFGAAMFFLFTASLQVTLLGAAISLAPRALYPVYEFGSSLYGLAAVEDQRLASLVMRTPMALIFLVTLGSLFLRWLAVMEKRAGSDPSERFADEPR